MNESAPVKQWVPGAVATLLIRHENILLGRRFESGQFIGWQCPGGYLQKGESVQQAASRHCLEKAGIEISQIRAGPYSNNIFDAAEKHTISLYVIAEAYTISRQSSYKNALSQWSWFNIDALPTPLFLPLNNLLEEYNLAEL